MDEPTTDEAAPIETDARAMLIHNEQVKARAGLYNSMAGATFLAGSVSPLALLFFGTFPTHRILWLWVAGMIMFLTVGVRLQRLALRTLEGLKA